MHRLVKRVEDHVAGAPLAAGAFEPNIVRLPEFGIVGLIGMPVNWRREQRALDAGVGLAPSSLVVVTQEEVYVFDAWLLSWGGVRVLLQHARDELVARPVALAEPRPPAEAALNPPERAALRLEDRSGDCLAELAPQGWGNDVKGVFKALTGDEGWPKLAGKPSG